LATASATLPVERSDSYRAILWGGILAGVFDILFAFIYYGRLYHLTPVDILHSVAAGLIGRDASRNGGLATAALGLVLHFIIAFGAAAVYYIASRKLDFLVRQAVVYGLLYGIVVYVVMNFVVLPLSAAPPRGVPPFSTMIVPVIGHMLLIGLPIALAVRRYSR
jgi:uncharacterized membrane protein YagU involved in acid resistance